MRRRRSGFRIPFLRFLPYPIRLFVLAVAVLYTLTGGLGVLGKHVDPNNPLAAFQGVTVTGDPVLTQAALTHILYGDERGGGHLHGMKKPCKSEFPASWNERKISDAVLQIAANDNLPWKKQDNGYSTAEAEVEGIRVRVVLNRGATQVVTAYPVNVPRNPCPVPANDN